MTVGAALAAGYTPPWMQWAPPPRDRTVVVLASLPPRPSHILWCVWPVTLDRDYTRDELVDRAATQLDRIAHRAGARITGPATFRILDEPRELEGWEHWDGWLLIATMPAEPLPAHRSAAA